MFNELRSSQALSEEQFKQVVFATPLVSIDLVVLNAGRILLGQRLNRPAKGYWFVPGGRIRKGESIESAFGRLTTQELGVDLPFSEARLLGAYDHFYSDSVFGESPSTHYVALGMLIEVDQELKAMPDDQHDSFTWWPIQEALDSYVVHQNTKAYLLAI
ncbi:GDP-mannose mannosyl hydrolase [Nitrincola sp. MINF-07-Sa-05]|uniref:GDP-mannose mannosyl hydrolase n=1 Tax=Nitrincola salilacus TaxID=3400273 RepID=UPI003917D385